MRDLPPIDDRLLYNVDDAARILSIGRSMLYLLFERGDIEPVKIGRRILVSRATLERYVDRLRAM